MYRTSDVNPQTSGMHSGGGAGDEKEEAIDGAATMDIHTREGVALLSCKDLLVSGANILIWVGA